MICTLYGTACCELDVFKNHGGLSNKKAKPERRSHDQSGTKMCCSKVPRILAQVCTHIHLTVNIQMTVSMLWDATDSRQTLLPSIMCRASYMSLSGHTCLLLERSEHVTFCPNYSEDSLVLCFKTSNILICK